MYRPVMPCVLAPVKGDRRPLFAGSMLSARMRFVRVAEEGRDVVVSALKTRGGWLSLLLPIGRTFFLPDAAETRRRRKLAGEARKLLAGFKWQGARPGARPATKRKEGVHGPV